VPTGEPVAEPNIPEEQPPNAPAEQQPDGNHQPYLTRVLEHIPGDAGDSTAVHPTAESAP
jgi:hypothetical protein